MIDLPLLEDFISVRDIGVFLVPPTDENEPFPGASIFNR